MRIEILVGCYANECLRRVTFRGEIPRNSSFLGSQQPLLPLRGLVGRTRRFPLRSLTRATIETSITFFSEDACYDRGSPCPLKLFLKRRGSLTQNRRKWAISFYIIILFVYPGRGIIYLRQQFNISPDQFLGSV